jgi:hypothetical protein
MFIELEEQQEPDQTDLHLTFLTPDDRSMWNSINKLIDPNFKPAPSGYKKRLKKQEKRKGAQ